mgnify:CR=1 FL=1
MNEMKVFENSEFGQVRTVEQNGEPWFVAADVCRALGIGNSRDATAKLDDDEKNTVALTDGNRGNPNVCVVNEPGLYTLVLSSRKPEAKAFKRWITHEVIPAIRKTGGYIAGEEQMTDDELLARALTVASEKLKQRDTRIIELTAENSELVVKNQIMQPKADYFDQMVDRSLLTSFRETAKLMEVKEKAFVKFLLEHKYIYRDKKGKLMPYEAKNSGLFETKECINDKTGWGGTQTLITPKGRETFRLLMEGA